MTAADETRDPDILAEVRLLRAEVSAFTRDQRASADERRKILRELSAVGEQAGSLHERITQIEASGLPRRLWPRVILGDLGTNPLVQYRFHIAATWFWIAMTGIVTIVFFAASDFWAKASIFYIVLISHYANASTEYGSASASLAAIQASRARRSAERASEAAEEATTEIKNGNGNHEQA